MRVSARGWRRPGRPGSLSDQEGVRLKYELIALLRKGSKHGYSLSEEIKCGVGLLQQVKHPQIYATLERLERDGLVTKERVPQDARPDRNVYHLTDRAQEEYRRWLAEPVKGPRRLKDEFFLKLFFAQEEGEHPSEKLISAQEAALLQTLADLQALRKQAKREGNNKLYLLAEGALLHARADLKWLESFQKIAENPQDMGMVARQDARPTSRHKGENRGRP